MPLLEEITHHPHTIAPLGPPAFFEDLSLRVVRVLEREFGPCWSAGKSHYQSHEDSWRNDFLTLADFLQFLFLEGDKPYLNVAERCLVETVLWPRMVYLDHDEVDWPADEENEEDWTVTDGGTWRRQSRAENWREDWRYERSSGAAGSSSAAGQQESRAENWRDYDDGRGGSSAGAAASSSWCGGRSRTAGSTAKPGDVTVAAILQQYRGEPSTSDQTGANGDRAKRGQRVLL